MPLRRWLPIVLTLSVGCASVNPARDYGRATALSAEVTGEHEVWTPVDDRCVDDRVQTMLSDGLTISDAVKIALFENRTLRARMLDIGIAKADLVQAGLWSNPTASFSIRFPTDGGTRTIDASLFQSIAEFWQVPVRRCAAARGLEQTTLHRRSRDRDTRRHRAAELRARGRG